MKISVTLLSSYLYCPRKLFLEKVLMLEEPPKESLVMGSIRHETYDKINKAEEMIVTSISKGINLESLQALYRQECLKMLRKSIADSRKRLESINISPLDAYRKHSNFIIEESLARASNVFSFMESNDVFGEELWQKLTPKIISEIRIESDTLRLKGIIDQVHVYENEFVPFELKTGKMPQDGVWPSHRIQLAAYSMLIEEYFGKPVKEGFVVYLDSGEKRHIVVNPFMKEEIGRLVSEVTLLLESKKLPDFCDNENKCRKCGLKNTCYNENEVNDLVNTRLIASSTQRA